MELTYDEAYALEEFIEINIFNNIRNDEDIDNMNWLLSMCEIYKKCKEITGDR